MLGLARAKRFWNPSCAEALLNDLDRASQVTLSALVGPLSKVVPPEVLMRAGYLQVQGAKRALHEVQRLLQQLGSISPLTLDNEGSAQATEREGLLDRQLG